MSDKKTNNSYSYEWQLTSSLDELGSIDIPNTPLLFKEWKNNYPNQYKSIQDIIIIIDTHDNIQNDYAFIIKPNTKIQLSLCGYNDLIIDDNGKIEYMHNSYSYIKVEYEDNSHIIKITDLTTYRSFLIKKQPKKIVQEILNNNSTYVTLNHISFIDLWNGVN